MYLGKLVELADRDDLYERPLHPYTRALMSAVPVPDPVVARARERIRLTGELPSPSDPPTGCAFHTRCPKYQGVLDESSKTRCRTTSPTLEEKQSDHLAACHFPETAPLWSEVE
jgi:oligopeptide/dipeptide ABC transporter ATP-binding protein